MSTAAWRYAMAVPHLSPSERLLFIYLADRADKNGTCFPSQSWLAKRTGLSVRTIRDAMKSLVVKGHMEQERRSNSHGRTSDMLHLRLPLEPAKSAATPRQNVPTIPSSPYGVGKGIEGEGARQGGAVGLRLVHSSKDIARG